MAGAPVPARVGEPLRFGSARGRWVLLATVLGSGVAALDATVVGIALPAIGRDFRVGLASLQWVVTAYTLTLAGLLLVGGALGDRYGRRRVFAVGVVWFAAASLLCGIAPSAPVLIAARALQGVGGALLTPGSLAILQASFAPADRSKAIGAWSGLGGVATAIGPFLGGWLIAAVSWRLVFFINLPLAAAVVVVAVRHVPESRDPNATGRVDAFGGLLAAGGLGGLTYGLIEGPGRGFASATVLGSIALGLLALTALMFVETHARAPMLPVSIFRSSQFDAANAVTLTVYAALGGALFLLPIELQTVAGYSPLAAGASLLPVTLLMLTLSARSGALAARIGPRLQMGVGPLVVAAGMALLVRIDTRGDYLTQVLPAAVVLGLGLATTVAPLTSTVLAAAPAEHAGVSSAINNDVARAAGLLAVALLPAAAGINGDSYLVPVAFDRGFGRAVLLSAALCAAGGLLGALTIRNAGRDGRRSAAADRWSPGERSCGLEAPPLRGGHHAGLPHRRAVRARGGAGHAGRGMGRASNPDGSV